MGVLLLSSLEFCSNRLRRTLHREGTMMHGFTTPNGMTYLMVKLCVLLLAIVLWWIVSTPQAI